MFKKLTIKMKLILLFLFIFISVSAGLGFILKASYDDMIKDEDQKLKFLVETVSSRVNLIYNKHLTEGDKYSLDDVKKEIKVEIDNFKYNNDDYFWIHDLNYKMIVHPNKKLVNTDVSGIKDKDNFYLFQKMNEIVNQSKEGSITYKWANKEGNGIGQKISYVKLFEPLGWIIGTGVYTTELHDQFISETKLFVLKAFVFLSILLIFIYFIARSILKPLAETLAAIEDVSKGDGDLTKSLEVYGNNEISQIRSSFNYFSQSLAEKISVFKPVSENLMNDSNKLKLISDELSNICDSQSRDIASTAAAMNEMLYTTENISTNADNTASSMNVIIGELNNVKLEANKSNESSKLLEDELLNSISQAKELVVSTEDVIQVIEVINNIASDF